ncbi:hypothetical protein [Sphingobacterium sp. 1.A.4]|uniref:hypothetical protein n=1 Tax=Sphingobacterium sp. 1.A.4 TaxID=2044603 RepID=UPI000C0BF293|nr:hypothetical protein [Sphingobacterium sp. 1.A.4]
MGSKLTKLANRLDVIEKHLGLQNEEDKPEIVIGKWYKDPSSNYLVHVTKVLAKHNYVEVYGFDSNGNWLDKWDTVVNQLCVDATPQEVEKALIEEAKRRYNVGDRLSKIRDDHADDNRFFELDSFSLENNCLYFNSKKSPFYSYCIFQYGQWATIIEQDKFAELKEAHRNGAVIESMPKKWIGDWTIATNPIWDGDNYEYRIKPEEKPKVGDVVKAWNDDEGQYFIGIVHEITSHGEFQVKFRKGTHFSGYYFFAKNAKTLNKQEAIDLLFGKEVSK